MAPVTCRGVARNVARKAARTKGVDALMRYTGRSRRSCVRYCQQGVKNSTAYYVTKAVESLNYDLKKSRELHPSVRKQFTILQVQAKIRKRFKKIISAASVTRTGVKRTIEWPRISPKAFVRGLAFTKTYEKALKRVKTPIKRGELYVRRFKDSATIVKPVRK